MPRGVFRRFYATASLFTPHHDECFRGLVHPESDADRPVMAGNDADDFRIKPGRSRTQRTRVRSHDLPFLQQVKAAVRMAGGNPNRIGRGSGSAGSRKGEGGGRFSRHTAGSFNLTSAGCSQGDNAPASCPTRFRFLAYFDSSSAMACGSVGTVASKSLLPLLSGQRRRTMRDPCRTGVKGWRIRLLCACRNRQNGRACAAECRPTADIG